MKFLLYALQKYQDHPVIDYFCRTVLSWEYWLKTRPFFMSAVLISTAAALVILAIAAYILTIAIYFLIPNYIDHGQPVVASISWLWMQGHDLYPNWETADIYGSVYGPILFLLNGIALLLYPTIFTSKVPGVLSLIVALGVTSMLIKQKAGSTITSMFLLASLVMLFVPFGIYAYWNRPEPFLILVSVLALMAAVRSPVLIAPVGVGVLAGLAAGFKIYGFIYTIPAALVALARVKGRPSRLIMALMSSACAVGFALLPYLAKGASIDGHLRFLKVTLHHGWSASLFSQNLQFAFVLVAPIIGISIWRKSALNPAQQWFLATLYTSIAIMTVLGAKNGGGPYYLLPLAPICIYGIAVLLESSEIKMNEFAAALFICLFVAYGPRLFGHTRGLQHAYELAAQSEPNKIAELVTYVESYPEAQIGISDAEHYSSYFYRVLSVFSGRPLRVDFSVWGEVAYAGVDKEGVSRFVKACNVPVWILPLGAPFTMVDKYNNLPMLSDGFRQTFSTNYRQIKAGHAYQVWGCKPQDE